MGEPANVRGVFGVILHRLHSGLEYHARALFERIGHVAYGTSGGMIGQGVWVQIAGGEPFEGADQYLIALSGAT